MISPNAKKRFIVVDVVPPSVFKDEAEKNLNELLSLVDTYGGATIVRVIQRRSNPDSHTYIGSGKADEVTGLIKSEKIDVVVLNDIVKQGQLFNLTKMFWEVNPHIEVWDRVDLILHIFDKHAHTAEAKLQIKLARMRHMGPRIYGLGGSVLSRQGGGIGTRGIGETNTELMKRHWRDATKQIEEELKRLTDNRARQLERRREIGLKTISIVGYTNAGKSTLFNLITRKRKKAEDALFATLDATVGKLWLPQQHKEVLVSDTIGFIQNLPARLVEAFRSTLMEAMDAAVLMHVVDASDPEMNDKIAVVQQVLEELGIHEKPTIYVFNKIDRLTKPEMLELLKRYEELDPQLLSAAEDIGMPELTEKIEATLAQAVRD